MEKHAQKNQKGKRIGVFLLIALLTLTTAAIIAIAQDTGDTASVEQKASWGINCVICKVANLIFMIVSALAAIVIILAGLKWLTSGDDPGARSAAKTAIISAFIGIIIVFIAVYVVSWVTQGLGGKGSQIGSMDIMSWIQGCNTPCEKATGGATPSPSGSAPPAGKTCKDVCGGKNWWCTANDDICIIDKLGTPNAASGDCTGTTPVCCCGS